MTLHWRDASGAKRVGDDDRDRMARECVELVRAKKRSRSVVFVETGDAIVLAFKSDRAPDEVEVIDAVVRRRGDDAPRGGLR